MRASASVSTTTRDDIAAAPAYWTIRPACRTRSAASGVAAVAPRRSDDSMARSAAAFTGTATAPGEVTASAMLGASPRPRAGYDRLQQGPPLQPEEHGRGPVRRHRVAPQRRRHRAPRHRVTRDPGRLDAGRVERGDGLAGGDLRCAHARDVCGPKVGMRSALSRRTAVEPVRAARRSNPRHRSLDRDGRPDTCRSASVELSARSSQSLAQQRHMQFGVDPVRRQYPEPHEPERSMGVAATRSTVLARWTPSVATKNLSWSYLRHHRAPEPGFGSSSESHRDTQTRNHSSDGQISVVQEPLKTRRILRYPI